jgi:cytoskeletal protein RodZ
MASFGETLKRERELREISLRQISEATKISIRYLEALEQNRFELLPGGLFNKGFIRAYATYVGLDGESMVNTYLHQIAASGPLPEPGSGRPQPGLHRPSEVPQRRTIQRPESSAPAASPSPASQSPAVGRETAAGRDARVGRETAMGRETAAARETGVGRESAMGRDAAVWRETAAGRDAALGRATHGAALPEEPGFDRTFPTRGAVRGIEAVDRTAASSRALLWIFSLVAGAGVVFLILTLATGRSPQDALPQDTAPHDGSRQGASPQGTSPQDTAPQAAAPAAPEAPATGTGTAPALVGAPVTETKPSELPPRAGSRVDSAHAPAPAPAPTVASVGGRQAESTAPQDARSARDEDWPLEEERGPSRAERHTRGVAMELQVEASSSAWIQVTCDAERVVDGMMHPGESLTTQCLNVIRVSATDAGAVGLSINGASCLPLGEPGTRVYGYTIRSDDFRRICPPSGRGVDDRR